MEGAVAVIDAGADEICQHVVAVGGADELPHGHAHLPGVVAGQDIAEVPGGHTVVDLLPQPDLTGVQEVAVGGDIVDHLGQDAAPVGGGEEVAAAGQLLPDGAVGEDALDAVLGVVKVASDRRDAHVRPLLCDHLQLLDLADPVFRVEYQDLCLRHVGEPLHSGLAGVAGGGHQDTCRLILPRLFQAGGEQLGQHLQGHVLKGAGGAVPQLQAPGAPPHPAQGRHAWVVELVRAVGILRVLAQLLRGEVIQKLPHDIGRPLLIGHIAEGFQLQRAQAGDLHRRKEAAVAAQAHLDSLGGAQAQGLVSCAQIFHMYPPGALVRTRL